MTVGVLTPHATPGPELEIPALTEGRVTTVVARAGSPTELRSSTEPEALEEASRIFLRAGASVVAHASTTTGYVIGARAEALLIDQLTQTCGVPAFASCAAAVTVLRAADIDRVQLIHPPWFDGAFDQLGLAYFGDEGFDVTVTRADALPEDPALVEHAQVIAWVEQHIEDRAEAVYLAGNGFRTAATVKELERRTGRTVVSANQALLRAILASTALPD